MRQAIMVTGVALNGEPSRASGTVQCALVLTLTAAAGYARESRVNSRLSRLPANRWVKIHEQREGDEVVLIGRQGHNEITTERLARLAGTIPYEIVCSITDRVPRIYKR